MGDRRSKAFHTLTPEISLIKNIKIFDKVNNKTQILAEGPILNDSSTVKLLELLQLIYKGLSPHLGPLTYKVRNIQSIPPYKTPVKRPNFFTLFRSRNLVRAQDLFILQSHHGKGRMVFFLVDPKGFYMNAKLGTWSKEVINEL